MIVVCPFPLNWIIASWRESAGSWNSGRKFKRLRMPMTLLCSGSPGSYRIHTALHHCFITASGYWVKGNYLLLISFHIKQSPQVQYSWVVTHADVNFFLSEEAAFQLFVILQVTPGPFPCNSNELIILLTRYNWVKFFIWSHLGQIDIYSFIPRKKYILTKSK